MKTHDELVKMQHQQCIRNMNLFLNEKMQELQNKKLEHEHVLDGLKIAAESVGYPDLDKYIDKDIVNSTFCNMLALRKVNEEIEALESTKSFLCLYDDYDKEFLKG